MLRRLTILAGLSVLALAPAADAADHRVTGRIESGPILLRGQALWAEGSLRTRTVRVVRGDGRVLFRRRLPEPLVRTVLAVGGLSASRRTLAFTLSPRDQGPSVLFGGRPPRRLRSCPEAFDAHVAGPLIATLDVGSACGGDGVSVLDTRTGRRTGLGGPFAREDGGIRIAGRYVAWQSADSAGLAVGDPDRSLRVVVYDRVLRRVALQTPPGFERGVEFDLAADGTLVVLEQSGDTGAESRITYQSPADPGPRIVDAPAVSSYGFRGDSLALAGGRIAHTRRSASGIQVVVTELVSGRSRVVAGLRQGRGTGIRRVGGIAFDGRRVAWAERRYARQRSGRYRLGRTVIRVRRAPG